MNDQELKYRGYVAIMRLKDKIFSEKNFECLGCLGIFAQKKCHGFGCMTFPARLGTPTEEDKGKIVAYPLCVACASRRGKDPQEVCEKVEAHLVQAGAFLDTTYKKYEEPTQDELERWKTDQGEFIKQ